MQILAFTAIIWLMATIYVKHPDIPEKVTQWILDDFPYRIVIFGFGGFVLVMLVNLINY